MHCCDQFDTRNSSKKDAAEKQEKKQSFSYLLIIMTAATMEPVPTWLT